MEKKKELYQILDFYVIDAERKYSSDKIHIRELLDSTSEEFAASALSATQKLEIIEAVGYEPLSDLLESFFRHNGMSERRCDLYTCANDTFSLLRYETSPAKLAFDAEIAEARKGLAYFSSLIEEMERKWKVTYDNDQHLEGVNDFLARGDGRGRLTSNAVVCDGKVGYFCVTDISVDGFKRDGIVFVGGDMGDDIVMTDYSMPTDEKGFQIWRR